MSKPENITVEISGMSCASCAQRIESAIGNIEVVSESIVNFATRKATVTGSVPAEEIHKIIEGLGYNVVKEDVPSISEEEIARSEWKMFLTSAILSVPVFIISRFMLHFKFPDLSQFILTTAVIFWPGIGFFKNVLKQVRHDLPLHSL